VDLMIIRVDRISARLFFGDDYLVVPESVGGRLSVPVDLKRLARQSKSVKNDMQRVRRLTSSISHVVSDCDLFYHTMYLPFLRQRHGDFAVVRSEHQVRRAFRRGGILWVHREEERIAGAVFEVRDRVLHFVALGISGDRLDLVQRGALAALYIFLIQYAAAYGCLEIDCGGSGPILNDGLLRYKAKWGVRLTRANVQHHYLVRWEAPNHVIRLFLRRLPLIFNSPRGGLCGLTAAWIDEAAELHAETAAIQRSLLTEGLEKLFIMAPSGNLHGDVVRPFPQSGGSEPAHRGCAIVCTAKDFTSTMAVCNGR